MSNPEKPSKLVSRTIIATKEYMNDLERLREVIRDNNLMEEWKFKFGSDLNEEEKNQLARDRALQARDAFVTMMNSTKNDGSMEYFSWGLGKALGLRQKSNPAFGTNFCRRPNRGMA